MADVKTETRLKIQQQLKAAGKRYKEFQANPDYANYDKPHLKSKKGRERFLSTLLQQFDYFTAGRLICKYTSQTGRTSKHDTPKSNINLKVHPDLELFKKLLSELDEEVNHLLWVAANGDVSIHTQEDCIDNKTH